MLLLTSVARPKHFLYAKPFGRIVIRPYNPLLPVKGAPPKAVRDCCLRENRRQKREKRKEYRCIVGQGLAPAEGLAPADPILLEEFPYKYYQTSIVGAGLCARPKHFLCTNPFGRGWNPSPTKHSTVICYAIATPSGEKAKSPPLPKGGRIAKQFRGIRIEVRSNR